MDEFFNFNQVTESKSEAARPGQTSQNEQLNLCDIVDACKKLPDDFKTHGPVLLDTVGKYVATHPAETAVAAVGGVALVAGVGYLSGYAAGAAMATGLCAEGYVALRVAQDATDSILPKVLYDKNKK